MEQRQEDGLITSQVDATVRCPRQPTEVSEEKSVASVVNLNKNEDKLK